MPQTSMTVDALAFDGYPDTVTLIAYDTAGSVLQQIGPVSVPDATPVPLSVPGDGIARVALTGTRGWSPLLDNHVFTAPTLTIDGSCGGVASVSITGVSPMGQLAVVRGDDLAGASIPSGGCAGTSLDVGSPRLLRVLAADGSGEVALAPSIPASFCGRYIQVVDLSTCAVTNAVGPL